MLVDTLASLHTVDPAAVGLSDLGKPEGYVERQLSGWVGRWQAARTPDTAPADRVIAWLRDNLPASPATGIVHNDYKLDNMLLDGDDPAVITALLDWDMCTLGDPLVDLGYMLVLWPERDDPKAWRATGMPTWRDGFPTRAEATARYAAKNRLRRRQRALVLRLQHLPLRRDLTADLRALRTRPNPRRTLPPLRRPSQRIDSAATQLST